MIRSLFPSSFSRLILSLTEPLRTTVRQLVLPLILLLFAGPLCSSAANLLIGWGNSSSNQLTNSPDSDSPVAIGGLGPLATKSVVQIASSSQHVVALASDGTVYCWGENFAGQLGNNSTTRSSTPVAVDTSGVLSGKTIAYIAAGQDQCYALSTDGHIYAWGYNGHGELGNNSTTNSSVPVAVDTSGVLAGKTVVSVAAGNAVAFALTSDGLVFSWGWASGNLGYFSAPSSLTPNQVGGAIAGKTINLLASGVNLAVVRDITGALYAWGNNVGDGSFINTSVTPVAVDMTGVMAGDTITTVAAGGSSGYALGASGKLYSWGSNSYGELGNGTFTDSKSPVIVTASGALAGKTVTAVAANSAGAYALDSTGKAYSWGAVQGDELGIGPINSAQTAPVAVVTSGALSGLTVTGLQSGCGYETFFVLATAPTTAAPSITTQPVPTSVTTGTTASFSVAASGTGLSYQWYFGATPLTGATSATLSFTAASADAGNYSVVVTNAGGSVTSTVVALTVTAAVVPVPVITTQPSPTSVTTGTTATFSVVASGSGLSYQWYFNTAPLTGATSAILSFTASSSDAGNYSVVVTNAGGSVTSTGVALTVTAAVAPVPVITTQPVAMSVTTGGTVTFSVVASGTGLSYQWYFGATPVSGATSDSLSFTAIASDAGNYSVVVTNAGGSVTSTVAALAVAGLPPVISGNPVNAIVASGHNVTFSGNASSSPAATYQWQVSTNGGTAWTNITNDSTYSGATTNELTVTNATSGINTDQYRLVATNSAGSVNSAASTIAVYAAILPSPNGVGVSSSGTVWATDAANNVVVQVTSAGVVNVIAGTAGMQGSTDGGGSVALFRQPSEVVVDSAGNAFVADTGNSTIRKVTASGTVTTFAGSVSHQAFQDGTGANAYFNAPVGLAIDSSDNIYVADTGNSAIRKITPAGVVTIFAGSTTGTRGSADGTGTAALFNQPAGLAIDSTGNLLVTDTVNQTIRKITPAGVVTTLAGLAGVSGSTDGSGAAALFNLPAGVTFDTAGQLYVADSGNAIIRVVSPTGAVSTLAGLNGVAGLMDGSGTNGWFNLPKDVKFSASASALFIADNGNAAIRKVTLAGAVSTVPLTVGSVPTPPVVPPVVPPVTPPEHHHGGGPIGPGLAMALLVAGGVRLGLRKRQV